MGARFHSWWADDSGSVITDYAIAIGLILAAGCLWFIQLGGEDGLATALTHIGRRAKQLAGIGR